MKRDMELVRSMLLDFSQGKGPTTLSRNEESLNYVYHLDIMKEAGLISFKSADTFDGRVMYGVPKLTWAGNDYIDAISNETVWNSTKQGIKEKGLELSNIPFSLLKDFAVLTVKQKLGLE